MWERILDHYAAYQRAAGLAERTIHSRAECLRRLAEHSGRAPQQIETYDLLQLLNRPHARTGLPLSPGTKQVERSYLQAWSRWMVQEGYIAHDPAHRLPRVKVPRRRARPVRTVHIDAMLDTRIWQSTRDMIVLAATTGLRIGEIVKIRGEDYDPMTHTLRSVRKGGLSHLVYLSPDASDIASRMPRGGWWFPSPHRNAQFTEGGGHVLMKSASTRISIVLRRAGITDPKITGHSLRHYYATQMLRQGVSVRVVQEMLGHASLATTQLYLEVTDDELAAAALAVPRIGGASGLSGRMAA